jgi:rfaE bifunctional protein kinase chain/domain
MENSKRLRLQGIVKRLSGVKVLVVGDLMLDRYWWGDVTRISPEAPVPVVRLREDSYAAGGAANVAANVAGLGAAAFLIGTVGADAEGEEFAHLIEDLNISTKYLVKTSGRPTTVKTRIIAHNQQIVRVDQEETSRLDEEYEIAVWERVESLIEDVDVVIVSDYAKGTLTTEILARLITKARTLGKPILVDPKGKDYSKYRGASLLTPNRREVAEACHLESETQDLVEVAGKGLLSELQLDAVLITQGEDGMTLFREGSGPEHLGAMAREIYDVTGAGDTVIACIGAALGAGADYLEAANLANLGASLVIQHIGTTFLTSEALVDALESPSELATGEVA